MIFSVLDALGTVFSMVSKVFPWFSTVLPCFLGQVCFQSHSVDARQKGLGAEQRGKLRSSTLGLGARQLIAGTHGGGPDGEVLSVLWDAKTFSFFCQRSQLTNIFGKALNHQLDLVWLAWCFALLVFFFYFEPFWKANLELVFDFFRRPLKQIVGVLFSGVDGEEDAELVFSWGVMGG